MILLAHHVELYHLPVLAGLFAAGIWVGWRLVSGWLGRGGEKAGASVS